LEWLVFRKHFGRSDGRVVIQIVLIKDHVRGTVVAQNANLEQFHVGSSREPSPGAD